MMIGRNAFPEVTDESVGRCSLGRIITIRKTNLNEDQRCIPACGEFRVLAWVRVGDGHYLVWRKIREDLSQDNIEQTRT